MTPSTTPTTNAPPAIAADRLSRVVPLGERKLTILDDVSLTVTAGETLAIVGASGSGKTTLLGLLAGLDRPDVGSVSWNGEPISTLSEEDRKSVV